MIFDRIIGNLETGANSPASSADTVIACSAPPPSFPSPGNTGGGGNPADDWLDLNWRDCFARASRRKTRGGNEIRILLPLGAQLRHGDLISNGARNIAIDVRPCEVLLLHPVDAKTGMLLALGLGNLHAPVQLDGEQLIVIPDGPVEELLAAMKVASTPAVRRFEPASIAAPLRAQLAANFQIIRV